MTPYDGTCPMCLAPDPLYPVTLPCKHVHCFLCVKTALQNGSAGDPAACDACAQIIHDSILVKPEQLTRKKRDLKNRDSPAECWFYKAGEDWWKYDQRRVLENYQIHLFSFLLEVDTR